MTKKQAEVLKNLMQAKVLVDFKDYAWLIKNYEELLEDTDILKSKELKAAEDEIKNHKVSSWEEVKSALKL